jgi:hypothetical protein
MNGVEGGRRWLCPVTETVGGFVCKDWGNFTKRISRPGFEPSTSRTRIYSIILSDPFVIGVRVCV